MWGLASPGERIGYVKRGCTRQLFRVNGTLSWFGQKTVLNGHPPYLSYLRRSRRIGCTLGRLAPGNGAHVPCIGIVPCGRLFLLIAYQWTLSLLLDFSIRSCNLYTSYVVAYSRLAKYWARLHHVKLCAPFPGRTECGQRLIRNEELFEFV